MKGRRPRASWSLVRVRRNKTRERPLADVDACGAKLVSAAVLGRVRW